MVPGCSQPGRKAIWNPISPMTCLGAVAGPHVVGGMPQYNNYYYDYSSTTPTLGAVPIGLPVSSACCLPFSSARNNG